MRLGQFAQGELGQPGVSEFEYAGQRSEAGAVCCHVALPGRGQQGAAGGGAGQAGGGGGFGQRHPGRAAAAEGRQDADAAGERLEVAGAVLFLGRGGGIEG